MNLRLVLTIITTKIIIKFLRLVKYGGTTLPGKVALFLHSDIIKILSKDIRIITVTGTNGKTTTSRIIAQILIENNIDFITNKSGANLTSGIATAIIEKTSIRGVPSSKTALIEVDEAAFYEVPKHFEPYILVVTNFFRDQLDRYGELYTTLEKVKSGIDMLSKTKLVLNADDSLCASIGKDSSKDILYFGFSDDSYNGHADTINSDAAFCIFCKNKYSYSNYTFGHLGSFYCSSCGYEKPYTNVTCTNVKKLTSDLSEIYLSVDTSNETVKLQTGEFSAQINLPGIYNIYNSLAAFACGLFLNLPSENSIKALKEFECGFGRMEKIEYEGKIIKVILVKNPTGFNQVLSYLLTEDKNFSPCFIINDNIADGTDISWLWDVDFKKLSEAKDKINIALSSGIRAEDMALRLKYAEIDNNKIRIEKDYNKLIDIGLESIEPGQNFFILPTYTAMLDIRKVMEERFGLKEFWR